MNNKPIKIIVEQDGLSHSIELPRDSDLDKWQEAFEVLLKGAGFQIGTKSMEHEIEEGEYEYVNPDADSNLFHYMDGEYNGRKTCSCLLPLSECNNWKKVDSARDPVIGLHEEVN